jgi:hypothetical protein
MGAADDGLAARGLQDDEYSEIEGDSLWELACLRCRHRGFSVNPR